MQYQLSRIVAGPFLRGLWRPEVSGAENVPETGGAILASNHLSILDSVFLPFMLKRPVTFTAKSEYFTSRHPAMRLMGRYLRATGQLPVDRDGARAAQATLEAALALLQQGQLFGIYPEGTRSPDGRLYRGRPGVGWLAMNSGLPVIPEAAVPSLFEPFRRMPARTGVGEGVGLGLSIARSVATAHRATVTIRSQPAGGLDISVVIPQP